MDSTTGSSTPKRAAMSWQIAKSLACSFTRKPAGYASRTMFGARCTKYQLEPAPAPSVLTTRSSGRLCAPAKAMASAQARMMPAHMIWLVALVAWPEPLGPKCSMVLPMAPSTGRAASKAARSPPHMIASAPFLAPSTPPLTGASMNSTLRSPRSFAAQRAACEARCQALDDGADVGVGGDADHRDVDETREFLEGGRGGDAELGGQ